MNAGGFCMLLLKKHLISVILFVTNILITLTLVLTLSAAGQPGPIGSSGLPGSSGSPGPIGPAGSDGNTPYIGENGNWWIDELDTNVPASGFSNDQVQKANDAFPAIIEVPDYYTEFISDQLDTLSPLNFSQPSEREAYVLARVSEGYIRINTIEEFVAIGTDLTTLSERYVLGDHLDFTLTPFLEGIPLASVEGLEVFTGVFDGADFTLENFSFNSSKSYFSLFGVTSGAVIKNLNLNATHITVLFDENDDDFAHHVSLIAGYAIDTVFANISINNASINGINGGTNIVGLVAGEADFSNFFNMSVSNSTIMGGNFRLGLIAGLTASSQFAAIEISSSIIQEVFGFAGALFGYGSTSFLFGIWVINFEIYGIQSSYYSVGGLAGFIGRSLLWFISIEDVSLSASDHVGGLAGEIVDSEVSFVYGDQIFLTSNNNGQIIGGFFGHMIRSSLLFSSIQRFNLDGNNAIGGIAGEANNSFVFASLIYDFTINGDFNVGGVFGASFQFFTITNVAILEGVLIGMNSVGGMIGFSVGSGSISRIENSLLSLVVYSPEYSSIFPDNPINRGLGSGMGGLIGALVGGGVKLSVYQVAVYTTVFGEMNLGGMFGIIDVSNDISEITIRDSYAVTALFGFIMVGGVIGLLNAGNINIINSFFLPTFFTIDLNGEPANYSNNLIGGIAGVSNGNIGLKTVYYFNQSSPNNILFSFAVGGSAGAISIRNSEYFMNVDQFVFRTIWDMEKGWSHTDSESFPIPAILIETINYLYSN
jgi:hypothetical protein